MAKCRTCLKRNDVRGVLLQRPTLDECPVCNPLEEISPAEDACVCPPLGEPKVLTLVAPAVYDECGINLCRVLTLDELLDCLADEVEADIFDEVEDISLRVIDIDFNICEGGSEVNTLTRRPNCVRVTLTDICVTFAVKLLDERCRVIAEFCCKVLYLPSNADPDCGFDEETNPSAITVDLYAPYGVSYLKEYNACIPTISFLGFVEDERWSNNELRQGIVAQALAKVVNDDFDSEDPALAIGLTIYLKTVYFVQYKVPHEGLCVPPKCIPVEEEAINACVEFVEGDLLEQSVQPLELCCEPKTISRRYHPVEDPTPAEECNGRSC